MKDFLPKTLRDSLLCLLLAALLPISVNLWWNARLGIRQANGTLQNVNQMSARGDEWLAEQLATLRSEQYQTLMRNNLAAGSYLQSITNSLNRSTIPLLNRNLTSSNEGLLELRALLRSGNVMLVDVNRAVSAPGGVLPQTAMLLAQLTDTTRRAGELVSNQDVVLQALVSEGAATLKELREIVESDEWAQIRSEMLASAKNIASTTARVDETSVEIRDLAKAVKETFQKYAPGLLETLEKIARTSSRFQKATLLANIFRILAIGLGAL